MKDDIAEIKNTVEGIHRFEEAEDWISESEDKVEKEHSIRAAKGETKK